MLRKFLCLVWPKYRRNQQRIAWLILEGWEPFGFEGWARTELYGLIRDKKCIRPHSSHVDNVYDVLGVGYDPVGWGHVEPKLVDHFYQVARKVAR